MTPAETVGIIGAGQLARMMAQAAVGMGLRLRLFAEAADAPAAQVMADVTVGDFTNPDEVLAWAVGCDAITFDHEHVPVEVLQALDAAGIAAYPSKGALKYAQDKIAMREMCEANGFPTPRYRVCHSASEVVEFGEQHGWPVIAKTPTGGYDGKGVWRIEGPQHAHVPFAGITVEALGAQGAQAKILVEECIDFVRELSALVARGTDGESRCYPVVESVQTDGICTATIVGEDYDCRGLAADIADALDVVGILAVELMQRADGTVAVNELAMRPHNTGHWTIDAAVVSQFENHLRAVAGWPLGDTKARAPWVVMRNMLGGPDDLVRASLAAQERDRSIRIHIYGKSARPGRKVGHITVYDSQRSAAIERATLALETIMQEGK